MSEAKHIADQKPEQNVHAFLNLYIPHLTNFNAHNFQSLSKSLVMTDFHPWLWSWPNATRPQPCQLSQTQKPQIYLSTQSLITGLLPCHFLPQTPWDVNISLTFWVGYLTIWLTWPYWTVTGCIIDPPVSYCPWKIDNTINE